METDKNKTSVFLVLAPHRDARAEFRKYSQSLHKKGLKGVYNFPCAAPIALLTKPLTQDELKIAAKSLRALSAGEKFHSSKTACASFTANGNSLLLFGSNLNFNIDPDSVNCAARKIKKIISPLVVGGYLQNHECSEDAVSFASRFYPELIPAPVFSFRAAAIANMFWRPVNKNGEIFYKWKIGKLSWLPRTLQK